MLQKIRTILIHNSHPGNIGAAARSLKNMGLSTLYLVSPKEFPSEVANARAKGAIDILENAKVVENLAEALQGCCLVYGMSSRERKLNWPLYTAREAAKQMIAALDRDSKSNRSSNDSGNNGDIALLLGCEQHGLSNEELSHCHAQIIIPTHPGYPSLNVAQALQIMTYELWLAAGAEGTPNAANSVVNNAESTINGAESASRTPNTPTPSILVAPLTEDPPMVEEMISFYQHLEQTLVDIHFLDREQPGQLMTRMKRLFSRAKPDKIELKLLRGILTAMQKRV